MLAALAFAAPAAHAAEHRYQPVEVKNGSATFALHGLSGPIVSARLSSRSGKSRAVPVASVRRARKARTKRSRLLRVSVSRKWQVKGRAAVTLSVRTSLRAKKPVPPPPPPPPPSDPVPPPPPPAIDPTLGTLLWKADAEATMSQEWASSSSIPVAASPPNPDPTRIAQTTTAAQGLRAYKFEMRDGDDSYGERAELAQGMPAIDSYLNRQFKAGEERWISLQYYFPGDWPTDNTWMTVLQIKPSQPGGGGPNIGVDAGYGGKLYLYGASNTWGSTAGTYQDGGGPLAGGSWLLPRSKWVKLTLHAKFSADPAVGFVEIFGDLGDGLGMRTLAPLRKRPTMKYVNGVMDPVHLRVGIYRDPAIVATGRLWVDGVTVATTRATAEANAFRAAG